MTLVKNFVKCMYVLTIMMRYILQNFPETVTWIYRGRDGRVVSIAKIHSESQLPSPSVETFKPSDCVSDLELIIKIYRPFGGESKSPHKTPSAIWRSIGTSYYLK